MGSGRLGAGGNPEWRGQGVAAGGLEVCVVLLLAVSLSPSFSVSLTCGLRLLTFLGGGGSHFCIFDFIEFILISNKHYQVLLTILLLYLQLFSLTLKNDLVFS